MRTVMSAIGVSEHAADIAKMPIMTPSATPRMIVVGERQTDSDGRLVSRNYRRPLLPLSA